MRTSKIYSQQLSDTQCSVVDCSRRAVCYVPLMSLFCHQSFVPLRVLACLTSPPRLWPSAFCVTSVCLSVSFSLTCFTEHSARRGLSMSQMARFQGRIDEHLVLPFGFESSHLSQLVLLRTGSFTLC